MNINEISIQLYTTRKFTPYRDIFKFISSTGIKNIELFALSDFDEKELNDLLQEFNLTSLSAHISYESLANVEVILNKLKFLNIKHAIIPAPKAIPEKNFEDYFKLSEEEWINFAKEISDNIKIFNDNGLTLGYHNHSFEFNALSNGKYPIEYILDENENLKFEIDLGWATAGNADPLEWINKYKNQIIACHLKDFHSNENMLDHENQSSIGEGFINWIDLLKKISETPCEVIAIEHDDPKDYKSYITKSLEYLLEI